MNFARVVRGRIVAVSRHGQRLRPEGPAIPSTEPDDLPSEIVALRPPTVRCLLRALGFGVLTDPNGRLMGAAGQPLPGLYYAGPLWRRRDREITAVAALRVRLPAVAAAIAASVVRRGVLA